MVKLARSDTVRSLASGPTLLLVQLGECTRVAPVPEPEPVIQWITAEHGDERIYYESHNENNLSDGEPELGFAVMSDGKDVESAVMLY